MVLEFKIGNTVVEEPIGFDSFKVKLERGSEHGISAAYSVGTLEFYGAGYALVQTAYNTDLDTQLVFSVGMKCDDADLVFSPIYSGVIDLTSYSENIGDRCSCTVSVGQIGEMTTFINRADTDVSLVDGVMTDLDGIALSSVQLSKIVSIPSKEIVYVTEYSNANTVDTLVGTVAGVTIAKQHKFGVFIGLDTTVKNDIKGNSNTIGFIDLVDTALTAEIPNFVPEDSLFHLTDLRDYTTVGFNAEFSIDGEIRISRNLGGVSYNTGAIIFYAKFTDGVIDTITLDNNVFDFTVVDNTYHLIFDFTGSFSYSGRPANTIVDIWCIVYCQDGNTQVTNESDYGVYCQVNSASFKITANSATQPTNGKLTMPHEALNRLANVYSGLTVKSDWFGREDAAINPISTGVVGGGALKGILNGLQLRNADKLTVNPTLFTTSFKKLYLALKAIDNLGWGFSVEDETLYIRVENWKWFYNDTVILTIDNPANKVRKINTENIYSRAKIGYKKYFAIEDVNSIDTIHTERTYNNGLKAIDKEVQYLSDLVADPFAIEVTRRLSLEKETKDWKFDDNLFVLAMYYQEASIDEITYTLLADYSIVNGLYHQMPTNMVELMAVNDTLVYNSGNKTVTWNGLFSTHSVTPDFYEIISVGDVLVYNATNYTITNKNAFNIIVTSPSLPSSTVTVTMTKNHVINDIKEDVYGFLNLVRTAPNFPNVDIYVDFTTANPVDANYFIEQGYVSSTNFESPNTTFNTRISPARNALKLADSLFAIDKPTMRLTASTGNVKGSGKSIAPGATIKTLYDPIEGTVLSEDANITQPTRLLSSEIIELEYPISVADFKVIEANPYGKVVVDGEDCWIDKIEHNPIDTMAKLVLIKKAV